MSTKGKRPNRKTQRSLEEVKAELKARSREARLLLGLAYADREIRRNSMDHAPGKRFIKKGPITKGSKAYYGTGYSWNGMTSTVNAAANGQCTRTATEAEEKRIGTLRRGFRGEWQVA